MTLREKQRLRWIVKANAREYRRARRSLVLVVMRGANSPDTRLDTARQELTLHAMAIAEAIASLDDHAEGGAPC